MRAEAVDAHPANMKRSGTMFEGAVRARMIGAVTEGIAKNSFVNPLIM